MTSEDILTAITVLAHEKLDYEGSLSPEMRLVEDLELDSIRLLTLATEIEDHFRLRIDEADEAAIVTIADLISVVENKLAS